MLLLLVFSGAVSFFVCGLLLRYDRGSSRRYGMAVPQRFHAGHVPRLGGVAMMVACTVGLGWIVMAERLIGTNRQITLSPDMALAWWVAATIAATGGVAEDVTHRLNATWRLLITLLAGAVAVWSLGLSIPSLGVALIQPWWAQAPWAGLALAILAVAGLPHAFNLIDGYNGLAGTVALICCLALAYVSLLVGDRQLAAIVIVLAGATAGFLFWNYPRGLIFAGDGGAYLWGVIIGMASIQLVQRHPSVSPWFPVLLLIYPVWETIFSIYRKLARGQSPGVADALHFHQLIYRRIVRGAFEGDDEAKRMLMRNSRTSPYLWGFTILTVIPAVLFWNNTHMLMFFAALFVISYVWAYVSIVRFKVPRWLRR
jgi:UDP-GlcNAc:undecaprenyl-phosphate/decaprenyl-phosphate GlcNAc-1-phosphate transferase